MALYFGFRNYIDFMIRQTTIFLVQGCLITIYLGLIIFSGYLLDFYDQRKLLKHNIIFMIKLKKLGTIALIFQNRFMRCHCETKDFLYLLVLN